MTDQICWNCRFLSVDENVCECRRHAPRESSFPRVSRKDWCAEFEQHVGLPLRLPLREVELMEESDKNYAEAQEYKRQVKALEGEIDSYRKAFKPITVNTDGLSRFQKIRLIWALSSLKDNSLVGLTIKL